MEYLIKEKSETAARESLYGPNARRYSFELEHKINGATDSFTSRVYVDEVTFQAFDIGERVVIGMDIAYASPQLPLISDDQVATMAAEPGLAEPVADAD